MRKELYYGIMAFLFCSEANAACMPELDCASLGYKYSYSQCGGKGLACLYDSGKYFCPETVSSCTYQYTKENCAAECKNVGSLTCSKNGTTYYASCGSSKCSSGETCQNGSCQSFCSFTYTSSKCASLCQTTGSNSCIRNGTIYYESCGSSKCSSGQTCEDGVCKKGVEIRGYCCDDGDRYCGSGYADCQALGAYPDCSDMRSSCLSSGGSPSFLKCGVLSPSGAAYAYFNCNQFTFLFLVK